MLRYGRQRWLPDSGNDVWHDNPRQTSVKAVDGRATIRKRHRYSNLLGDFQCYLGDTSTPAGDHVQTPDKKGHRYVCDDEFVNISHMKKINIYEDCCHMERDAI
jgi:hypothetical protein